MARPTHPTNDQLSDIDKVLTGGVYYVIMSDSRLLTLKTEEFGVVFPVWESFEAAEVMCPLHQKDIPLRASRMDGRDLLFQLVLWRDQHGAKHVVKDRKPNGECEVIPIEETIKILTDLFQKTNAFRAEFDECIRILQAKRKLRLPINPKDEQIPIDCGFCGGLFIVHEIGYRKWRSRELATLLCPKCGASVLEGHWDTTTCGTCGAQSGIMPKSMCENYKTSSEPWRCINCQAKEADETMRKHAGSSGCLVFLGIAATVLVLFGLAF